MLTLSTVSRDLRGEGMCQLVLNALSDGTLVAGMHKKFFATLARGENCFLLEFHHSRESSALRGYRDRYRLISIVTLCSGLWDAGMNALAAGFHPVLLLMWW